mgnify:CR=1 FL=1
MSAISAEANHEWLAPRQAVWVFLAFALAYFLSALVRAVTATLSPVLSVELSLQASDLGLPVGRKGCIGLELQTTQQGQGLCHVFGAQPITFDSHHQHVAHLKVPQHRHIQGRIHV